MFRGGGWMCDCQEPGEGRVEGNYLLGIGFPSGKTKAFWNWIVVMISQFWEYPKTHCMLYFKRMNCTVFKFYVHF